MNQLENVKVLDTNQDGTEIFSSDDGDSIYNLLTSSESEWTSDSEVYQWPSQRGAKTENDNQVGPSTNQGSG